MTALARAWTVTTIAVAFFWAAFAIVPMWDTATFMQAVCEAASSDPLFGQPIDQARDCVRPQ